MSKESFISGVSTATSEIEDYHHYRSHHDWKESRSMSPELSAPENNSLSVEIINGHVEWWQYFVKIIQSQNAEVKVPVPNGHDKLQDWAIAVSSQILSSQSSERRRRILQFIVLSPDGISYIIKTLEDSLHSSNAVFLSHMLRESVNPRNGSTIRSNAIRKLVESDTHLDTIIKMLSDIQTLRANDTKLRSDFTATTVNLLWVLSALAEKDHNFVAKIRTLSKVKFLHGIMKSYFFGKHQAHYPLLKIFRVLCKNRKVAVILGKDKIMKLFVKIFNTFNNQPSTKFLMTFDILNQLTKHRENCRRILKAGLLINIMRAFSYWALWKGHGLLKLSKMILSIYSHLCTIKTGRKALVETEALHYLKKFCEQCPNERAFDDIMMKATHVTFLAHQKDKLPLDDLQCPAKFDVPKSRTVKLDKDSGSSSDEDDPDDADDLEDDDMDDGGDDADDDDSVVTLNEDLENENELLVDDKILNEHVDSVSKSSLKQKSKEDDQEVPVISPTLNQPPEVVVKRLAPFAHFFRELDGALGNNEEIFESAKNALKNSIVMEVLNELDGRVKDETSGLYPTTELKSFWLSDHPEYGDSKSAGNLRAAYTYISNRTRSVIPFVKIAYPDLVMAYGAKRVEYINPVSDRSCLRSKILTQIHRATDQFKPKVVYDLDALLNCARPEPSGLSKKSLRIGSKALPSRASTNLVSSQHDTMKQIGNDDEKRLGSFDGRKDGSIAPPLAFESRFESGNLRKAIQVGEREYDLYLMSDVNSNRHNQWFYFQISNTLENVSYTFNIMNCIKPNSQFNYGMQPVVFSVGDAVEGRTGWYRTGSGICYFRSGIRNVTSKKKRCYHMATFSMTFNRRGDICYIAYHYPYTYTRMMTEIVKLLKQTENRKNVMVRYDFLCQSLNHNEVPLLTITGANDASKPVELRDVIFLSSRVHPGESNASWVMHGILHNLLFGNQMESVLKHYVFKIIPMLNVEGVINGCHRCGLTNEDLNRRWKNPDSILHPTIYHAKSLIEFSCKVRNKVPVLYCDLHGHSRKKNVFFYGCSKARSWSAVDRSKSEDPNILHTLPEAVARRSPAFALPSCNFDVRKSRESTARVALWREFGINRSYTLESSFCGYDRGIYKGLSVGLHHLIEVGESLCESVEEFYNPPVASVSEYSLTSSVGPGGDPSKINLCNPEDSSWNDEEEAPSPSSSETDFGFSETDDDEWNQGSLNPIIL